LRGHGGRYRMILGLTCAYHHSSGEFNPAGGQVYSIQHYVIKFVSDFRQVGGFLRILWFPSPLKLIATIQLKYC
jgi:hypothetical protein